MRYSQKWPEYARQWDSMQIVPKRAADFTRLAKLAIGNRTRYERITLITGVPWYMLAAIHQRESGANFNTYLGNGERLNHATKLVPKGRGPFTGEHAFEDGAVDALKLDGLATVMDWRLEKILYYCELFNGFGYAVHDLPSPYLWGGTNIQKVGKYAADGAFNPRMWDQQPGCAPIISAIGELTDILLVRET